MRIRWIGGVVVLTIAALTLPVVSRAQTRTFSPPIYYLTISEPELPPRGTSFTEYIGNSEIGSGGEFDDATAYPAFTIFYPVEFIDFVISWKEEAEPIGTLISPSGKQSTIKLENSCSYPEDVDPYCIPQFHNSYGMEMGSYRFILKDKISGRLLNEHRWSVEYPKKPFLAQYHFIADPELQTKSVAIMGMWPNQSLTINFYCPSGEDEAYFGAFIAQRTFKTGQSGALFIEIKLGDGIDCDSAYVVPIVVGYSPDYSYTAPWESFGGVMPGFADYPLIPSTPAITIEAKITVRTDEEHEFSVYATPSERSRKLELHERETFRLLDGPTLSNDEYWWLVQTRNGHIGWMREIDLYMLYSDY